MTFFFFLIKKANSCIVPIGKHPVDVHSFSSDPQCSGEIAHLMYLHKAKMNKNKSVHVKEWDLRAPVILEIS